MAILVVVEVSGGQRRGVDGIIRREYIGRIRMRKLMFLDDLVGKIQAEGYDPSSVLVDTTQIFTIEYPDEDELLQERPQENESEE
jgi:hypothetical protein